MRIMGMRADACHAQLARNLSADLVASVRQVVGGGSNQRESQSPTVLKPVLGDRPVIEAAAQLRQRNIDEARILRTVVEAPRIEER